MSYTGYAQLNLESMFFIGGTDFTLEFTVYNQDGSLADLSGASVAWKMAPYGDSASVLSYAGTITGANTFEVHILGADTLSLDGIFIHQPIVTKAGEDFRSQQGEIVIGEAIR